MDETDVGRVFKSLYSSRESKPELPPTRSPPLACHCGCQWQSRSTTGPLNSMAPSHDGFFGTQQSIHGLVEEGNWNSTLPLLSDIAFRLLSVNWIALNKLDIILSHITVSLFIPPSSVLRLGNLKTLLEISVAFWLGRALECLCVAFVWIFEWFGSDILYNEMKRALRQSAFILMRELSWRFFGHKIDWRKLFLLAAILTISSILFQMLVHRYLPNDQSSYENDSSHPSLNSSTTKEAILQQRYIQLLPPHEALMYAKKEINNAPLVNEDPDLNASLFRNISVFESWLSNLATASPISPSNKLQKPLETCLPECSNISTCHNILASIWFTSIMMPGSCSQRKKLGNAGVFLPISITVILSSSSFSRLLILATTTRLR
ncbi:hypothetical protein HN873_002674 [Arachis hypogaea]